MALTVLSLIGHSIRLLRNPRIEGNGVLCSVNTEIYGLNKRTHTQTHIGTQTGVGQSKKCIRITK